MPYVLSKPADPRDVLQIVGRVLSGVPAQSQSSDAAAQRSNREQLRLLADELSDTASDLRAANARLRAIVNIGLELGSRADSERLLQRVCYAAHDLFGATYATLGIVDPQDGTVRRMVTCGIEAVTWITAGEAVPGVLGAAMSEGRTLRGDNRGGDAGNVQFPALHPEVQIFLAAPITSSAHVHGWICLVSNEGRTFTDEDEDLLTALAGQVGRIYEIEHEVLERREAESALRHAEERMRFALEAAGVGIWDMDYTTGVLEWSEILESQYGLPPGTFGKTAEAFTAGVHPDDRPGLLGTIAEAARTGKDFSTEHRTIWPDGTIRWVTGAGRIRLGTDGTPLRGVGISLDVTERHALEAQYQHSQKMEAVGQLAGGIAHDFNNLLTAILGYCHLLLDDLDAADPRREEVGEIRKAGEIAVGLTRQLLAFSRKQIFDRDPSIDVLLTDVVMPGMSGPELTRRLLQQRPALKVIYMSGYTEDVMLHYGVGASGIPFLIKPFTADSLGRKVREALDGSMPGMSS